MMPAVAPNSVIRIRAGSGLGDSIYLRPIAEHFCAAGARVEALSDYPDVFRGSGAAVAPFRRNAADITAHYVRGKHLPDTTQFADMCRAAGIRQIPFRFGWTIVNQPLIDNLHARAAGRPIVVLHGGRTPMGRKDGFGAELLPERGAFVTVLDRLRDKCLIVRVGKDSKYELPVEVDLQGLTTVCDLIDIAHACNGWVAQCSLAVPLAEAFDKPLLAVWAARGLMSPKPYISAITPKKIFTRASSLHVIDNWTADGIRAVADSFRGGLLPC